MSTRGPATTEHPEVRPHALSMSASNHTPCSAQTAGARACTRRPKRVWRGTPNSAMSGVTRQPWTHCGASKTIALAQHTDNCGRLRNNGMVGARRRGLCQKMESLVRAVAPTHDELDERSVGITPGRVQHLSSKHRNSPGSHGMLTIAPSHETEGSRPAALKLRDGAFLGRSAHRRAARDQAWNQTPLPQSSGPNSLACRSPDWCHQ